MTNAAIELKSPQLEPLLDELCQVLALVCPDVSIGAAIYTNAGQLISTSAAGGFSEKLSNPSTSDRTGQDALKAAHVALERDSGIPPLILSLKTERSLNAEVFQRLCDVGRAYLLRVMDLYRRETTADFAVRELEAIIDHISEGLIVLDRSGVVRYINAPGAKILGVNGAKSVGKVF
jgi:PAS domain-containing protein